MQRTNKEGAAINPGGPFADSASAVGRVREKPLRRARVMRATVRLLALAMTFALALPVCAQVKDTGALKEADRVAGARFDAETFARTFEHRKPVVRGVPTHIVIGGQGPAVVLLHGWPGTWSYWRRVMPDLARSHTVIAVDMPGFGDSPSLATAEKTEVARHLRDVVKALGFERVSLVSHDMGGTVAYAFAAQFPAAVDRVVFTETAIPGFGFADGTNHDLLRLTPQSAAGIWHFAFFMKPGMAEMLVPGHERELIHAMAAESYTNPDAFGRLEEDELVQWISAPGGLAGGLAYYRALFADAQANVRLATTKLAMPVLVLNGEDGFLRYPGPASVQAVASNVSVGLVPASGHFIANERPHFLVRALTAFLDGEAGK